MLLALTLMDRALIGSDVEASDVEAGDGAVGRWRSYLRASGVETNLWFCTYIAVYVKGRGR